MNVLRPLRARTGPISMLAIVVALLASACGGTGDEDGANATSPSAPEAEDGADDVAAEGADTQGDPIRIGFVTSLSGGAAASGQEALEGAEYAVAVINAEGGVLGRPLELLVVDDRSTPEDGIAGLQRVLDRGATVVGGTLLSSGAVAQANVVNDREDVIFVITAAQTQQPLEEQPSNRIFGIGATNAIYAETYHTWIREELAPPRIAVVADTSDFGANELSSLEASLEGSGVEIATIERFDPAQADFSTIISNIRAADIDAVYFTAPGIGPHSAFYSQATDLGLDATRLINAGSMQQSLLNEAGDAVEGVYGADVWTVELDNATNQEFVDGFTEQTGDTPTGITMYGYETVTIIAEAMEVSQTTEAGGVADAMRAGTFMTPRGEIHFDDSGRAQSQVIVLTVENGKITPVE